ncbi:type II toxin-antitoxin system VapC family toxin [Svornostia abyssi]|uniref:Ribonuclease VapC n=1 Tax=Svornostia abyssi TaxID=2898438 RepID=A0ABY5PNG2_9ACTN|nr:type II toxin-antitoxin system VapC family toxin [Parviterribacteraceae bacterium J379]
MYFDTSAVVKVVIAEEGSREAVSLWNAATSVILGELAYPEARAAIAAARRARRLGGQTYVRAVAGIEELVSDALIIGVDRALARNAGDLADQHALRGYDAVHLASALAADVDVVVTWDRDLARAVVASGIAAAPAL